MTTSQQDARMWLRYALIVVGTFGIVRSLRYALNFGAGGPETLPYGIDLISTYVPLWAWGLLWAVAGMIAFLASIKVRPAGSLPVVFLSLFWAVGYTASWIVGLLTMPPGVPSRGDYLGASTYWTVALLLVCGYFLARQALKGSPVGPVR